MKANRAIAIVGIAVGCVILASWYSSVSDRDQPEPTYNGRTITEWLQDVGRSDGDEKILKASRKAVESIGTNGLPTLLRMARATDAPVTKFLDWLVPRKGNQRLRAHEKHNDAQIGFAWLDTNALAAVPELVKMTQNSDPEVRENAIACLSSIGPEKSVILPVLVRCMKDPNPDVRFTAASTIRNMFPHDAEESGVYRVFPDWKRPPK